VQEILIQLPLGIPLAVGDGSKASRLDEADEIGRDRHPHRVPTALQLTRDGGARLDVAPSSVACDGKLHTEFGLPFTKWYTR